MVRMNKSTITQRVLPIVIGLLTAYLAQGALMALPALGYALQTVLALALGAAVGWWLAVRVPEHRKPGWACVISGLAIIIYMLASILPGVLGQPLDRDSTTALMFMMFIFILPMTLVSIGLLGAGILLLRRR